MKYRVTIELESKTEAHEIIERLPLSDQSTLVALDPKDRTPWTTGSVSA